MNATLAKLLRSNAALLVAVRSYGPLAGIVVAGIVLGLLVAHVAMGATAAIVCVGFAGLVEAALAGAFAVASIRVRADSVVETAVREAEELRARVDVLEPQKVENEAILGAVHGHLMVIDRSFRIANRYSQELENVFHQRDLTDGNFLNVLQRVLSDRLFKTARDYLGLLFDGTKKERTVLKVNPLEEVEVSVVNPDRSAGVRYIRFSFRRIYAGDDIRKVLVSVEDVTDRTLLERQLRESEQKKVKQFELLIGILHVDPVALTGFVTMANEQLEIIDEALRATDFATATVGQTALLRQRLDVVMQRVHNIKGNASLLRLDHFEKRAQEFEQTIMDLKHRLALSGDDFLTVVIALAEFRSDLDDLQSLRQKLVGIGASAVSAGSAPADVTDPLIRGVAEFADTLAKKLGKTVVVDALGFDSRPLPLELRSAIKDVLVQLTRNSLTHGIESPSERFANGKRPSARIEIRATKARERSFAFVYRDDGRGLDTKRIRARAISAGLVDAARSARISDAEIAGFIFAPGFTTADDATPDAGRGMGMNVVKQRIVDDFRGEIGIGSEPGRYCEFSFSLPLGPVTSAAGRSLS